MLCVRSLTLIAAGLVGHAGVCKIWPLHLCARFIARDSAAVATRLHRAPVPQQRRFLEVPVLEPSKPPWVVHGANRSELPQNRS